MDGAIKATQGNGHMKDMRKQQLWPLLPATRQGSWRVKSLLMTQHPAGMHGDPSLLHSQDHLVC